MSVRIKFILDRDEKKIAEVDFEHSALVVPRKGEIIWFDEEPHNPAWEVEWIRHVFGKRGGDLVEVKLMRISK